MRFILYLILAFLVLTNIVEGSQPTKDTYPAIGFVVSETPHERDGVAGTVTIIDYHGLKFVTNAHVVSKKRFFEYIKFRNGAVRNFRVRKIDSKVDLALLDIQFPVDTDAVPLAPKSAKLGDDVFLVGFGGVGYQSHKCKVIGRDTFNKWIAVSTRSVPGTSGGPILNSKGLVVGIHWGSTTPSRVTSSAIDLNTLKEFLEE